MLKMPEDIVKFFFDEIKLKGKYEVIITDKQAKILPPDYQAYYKPVILVKDIDDLRVSLINYYIALNNYYRNKDSLKEYHTLSFFFNNLLFNMNNTDAEDLSSYIDKRTAFLKDETFNEYDKVTPIGEFNGDLICVERVLEEPGLETPYVLEFTIEHDNQIYQLPLIRCAIDNDNVCHLFAVQFGRYRNFAVKEREYKSIVNKINKGVKKYRNVSPGFVLTLRLFLDLLKKHNIKRIVIPDFLFCRYKNYYKATTTGKSDAILTRILDHFLTLIERMEYQFEDVNVDYYPNEIDAYTHITLEKKNTSVY